MRVVYYPFNTNTRLALDSSRSTALSISKRHAEEWWSNFGGEVGGLFSSRKKFFSQTLNPKRKRKYRKNSTVYFQHTHTHTETRLNAFHTTRAKRNTRISRSKRTEEYFLSLFFFGVLLILDTNFASLARAFSALFGIERIYGPCPHSTLLQK